MSSQALHKPSENGEEKYMLNNRIAEPNGTTGEGHELLNPEDAEKKGVIQQKKEQYIQSFTVHGVSRVFDGTRGETSFWCLIVIIGIAITSFGVYNLISKYLAYEIYTALSSKITNENPFPAITFCDNRKMISYYFSYCGKLQRMSNYPNPDAICNYLPDNPPDITNILDKKDEWSNGYFHITKCDSWGSRKCANDMYLKSLPRHNHSCFTWNYNGNFSDTYAHATLVFNTSLGSGEIVTAVHDHRISELELMHQVVLNSEYNYALNIRKSMIYRLPPPFPSKCTNGKPHDIFPGKYTRTTCVDSINYINILKQCGDTIDYVKRQLPTDVLLKHKQMHNKTIRETIDCMRRFSKRTVPSTNNCPVPCEELELMTMSTFHDSRTKGSYQVDIQLQDVDSYKVITEHQVFTWDMLAGGVGGFLGLMIGASLVSLIEILVYVFLCFVQKCFK